ncbi:MAG: tetratricopeptide repeat protein [Phycisphaerales bacterium]
MRQVHDDSAEAAAQTQTLRVASAQVLGIALLAAACVVVVWWGALDAAFVFDDVVRIVQREERFAARGAWYAVFDGSQRPLVDLTLAWNYAAGGLDPRGYHAFNIAVHAAAAGVLAMLVSVLLHTLRMRAAIRIPPAWDPAVALSIALLWALHPLQTSAATYVIQRAESMAALCTLSAALLLVLGVERRSVALRLAAGCAVVGAMCSKPTAVAAPFVLLALDMWLWSGGARRAFGQRPVFHTLAFASVGLLAVLGVTAGLVGGSGRMAGYGADVPGMDSISYLGHSVRALGFYCCTLCDTGMLAIDRGTEAISSGWFLLAGLAAIAGLVAATVLGWRRWWGFLPVVFAMLLAPTTSIVPIADVAVDHRMYLPSAVLAIAAVALGARIAARTANGRAFVAAALALLIVLEVRATIARNRVYADPIALWSEVVAQSPGHARGYINRAGLLIEAGRLEEAERDLDEAARLQPGHPTLAANRAILAIHRGEPEQAIELFATLGRDRRWDPALLGARADALRAVGRLDEALRDYEVASERAPGDARFRMLVGLVLSQLERNDEAIDAFAAAHALAREPELRASAAFNLGNAHYRLGRTDEAVAWYDRALADNPDHEGARRWREEAMKHG